MGSGSYIFVGFRIVMTMNDHWQPGLVVIYVQIIISKFARSNDLR